MRMKCVNLSTCLYVLGTLCQLGREVGNAIEDNAGDGLGDVRGCEILRLFFFHIKLLSSSRRDLPLLVYFVLV